MTTKIKIIELVRKEPSNGIPSVFSVGNPIGNLGNVSSITFMPLGYNEQKQGAFACYVIRFEGDKTIRKIIRESEVVEFTVEKIQTNETFEVEANG